MAQQKEQLGSQLIVRKGNHYDVWTISKELLKVAKPIARKLSISVTELLTRHTNDELVAVSENKNGLVKHRNKPPVGFRAPTIPNLELDRRLKRAAEFFEETPAEMVWRALADEIVIAEADMVVHPKSDRPIGDAMDLRKFQVQKLAK